MNLIYTIFDNLILYAFKTRTSDNTFQLNAKSIGKLATLSKEFKSNILYGCAFNFAIYKYIVHNLFLLSPLS